MSQQPKGVLGKTKRFSEYQLRDGSCTGVKEKKGEAMRSNWSINARKLIETAWAGEK